MDESAHFFRNCVTDRYLTSFLKTLHNCPSSISIEIKNKERTIIKNPRFNLVACAHPLTLKQQIDKSYEMNEFFFDKLLITVPLNTNTKSKLSQGELKCTRLKSVLFLTHMIHKTARNITFSSDAQVIIMGQLDRRYFCLNKRDNLDFKIQ